MLRPLVVLVGGVKIPDGPLVSVRVDFVAVSERPVLLEERLLVDLLLLAVRRLRLVRV